MIEFLESSLDTSRRDPYPTTSGSTSFGSKLSNSTLIFKKFKANGSNISSPFTTNSNHQPPIEQRAQTSTEFMLRQHYCMENKENIAPPPQQISSTNFNTLNTVSATTMEKSKDYYDTLEQYQKIDFLTKASDNSHNKMDNFDTSAKNSYFDRRRVSGQSWCQLSSSKPSPFGSRMNSRAPGSRLESSDGFGKQNQWKRSNRSSKFPVLESKLNESLAQFFLQDDTFGSVQVSCASSVIDDNQVERMV